MALPETIFFSSKWTVYSTTKLKIYHLCYSISTQDAFDIVLFCVFFFIIIIEPHYLQYKGNNTIPTILTKKNLHYIAITYLQDLQNNMLK